LMYQCLFVYLKKGYNPFIPLVYKLFHSIKLSKNRLNIIFAFVLEVIEKTSGYVVFIVLTRTVSQINLGEMLFAVSLSRLAAVTSNMGAGSLLIRKVASDPTNDIVYLSQIVSLHIVTMLTGFVILNASFLWIYPDLIWIMALVSAYTFLDEFFLTFTTFFAGKKQLDLRLLVIGSFKVIGTFLISVVAFTSQSLYSVLWLQVFLSLILVILGLYIVQKYFGLLNLKWTIREKTKIIKQSFPFLAINILGLMHMRFDTILVGGLLGLPQVTIYEIGIKLVEVARFMVRPFKWVLLPVFSEYSANSDWTKFRIRFRQMMLFAFGLGGGLTLLMFLFGSWVIPFVFGQTYIGSVLISKILFLSVPFLFAQFLGNVFASALHLEKEILKLTALTVLINIGLNLFAIPAYGINGAAWVTVLSQSFITISLLLAVVRKLFGKSVDINLENSA
jgi:O-antigen/teichoic acid export membrane protein